MRLYHKLKSKYIKIALLVVIVALALVPGGVRLYRMFHKNPTLCKNCNVVIIDLDILRADELPCFGYWKNIAPNICKFAENSIMFKQNYSTSYWTLPSLISTVTSLYPRKHGVFDPNGGGPGQGIPTMSQLMKSSGYNTYFNVNTRESIPHDSRSNLGGYDAFLLEKEQDWPTLMQKLVGQKKPFLVHLYSGYLHLPYLLSKNQKPVESIPGPPGFPTTRSGMQAAIGKYLSGHYREVFPEEVIKQYPGVFADNTPASQLEMANLFFDMKEATSGPELLDDWQPVWKTYLQLVDLKNPADLAYVRMLYDTKVYYLDAILGDLLKYLESPPVVDNTIVIIMSDHGEELGEHGRFSHVSSPYTELYYTPLILRVPGLKPKTVTSVTSNVDILPTLLEIIGLPTPPTLQGISLVPAAVTASQKTREFAFSQSDSEYILQNQYWLFFQNKFTPAGSYGLYNKISDPLETTNLAALPQYQDLVKRLSALVEEKVKFLKKK